MRDIIAFEVDLRGHGQTETADDALNTAFHDLRAANISTRTACILLGRALPTTYKARIYKQNEMDADHVTAWSKGGARILRIWRCSASHTVAPRVL